MLITNTAERTFPDDLITPAVPDGISMTGGSLAGVISVGEWNSSIWHSWPNPSGITDGGWDGVMDGNNGWLAHPFIAWTVARS